MFSSLQSPLAEPTHAAPTSLSASPEIPTSARRAERRFVRQCLAKAARRLPRATRLTHDERRAVIARVLRRLRRWSAPISSPVTRALLVASITALLGVLPARANGPFVVDAGNNPVAAITGVKGTAVAFGDLDGDSDTDMLLGDMEGSARLRYYRNEGSRTAPSFVERPLPIGIPAGTVAGDSTVLRIPAMGDFDNDGDIDVVCATGSTSTIDTPLAYYRNDGAGTFTELGVPPDGLPSLTGDKFGALRFKDVDFDGDDDVLMAAGLGGAIEYYRNDGGVFSQPGLPFGGVPNSIFYPLIDLADVDGDGDYDFFSGQYIGGTPGLELLYYRNDAGTLGSVPITDAFAGSDFTFNPGIWLYPSLVDIDGDGDLDLFVGDYESSNSEVPIHFRRNTPPSVASVLPVDDATGVSTSATFTITFSGLVGAGPGNVYVKRTGDNATLQTLAASSLGYSGTEVSFSPAGLVTGTGYYITWDANAFTVDGSAVTGNPTTNYWNFTTVAGPAPEIAVLGNTVNIADGDSTLTTINHTDFGSVSVSSGTVSRTYTIANSGDAPLTVGSVTVGGAHGGDFTVTSQPAESVNETTTFTVQFDPSASGLRSAVLSFTNNDADENPFDFAIQGTGNPNSAPVLAGGGTLAAVDEDTASPSGAALNTLGITADDTADSGTVAGYAVVGNAANAGTQGAWQYSTNAGTNWHAIGAVGDDATALALSSATLVRFVPVTDFNGTPGALTIRALDSGVGSFSASGGSETRVTIDTGTTGGSTFISAATATVSTSITSVNDTPTASNLTQSLGYTEDGGAVALADIVVSDADAAETVTATMTLSTPASGVLSTGTFGSATSTYNAGTGVWTVTGAPEDVNAALAAVTFTPAANYNADLSITARIRDAADTGPEDGTLALTGTPVPDAPTIANLNGDVVAHTEGGAFTRIDTGAMPSVADAELDVPDNYDGASITVVRAGGASTDDEFGFSDGSGVSLSGATILKSGAVIATFVETDGQLVISFTDANGQTPTVFNVNYIIRNITYRNTSDNPPANITLNVTVSDGALSSAISAVTVNITAVNDAPVLTGGGTLGAVNEDAATPSGAALNTLGITANDTADAGVIAGYAVVGNTADADTEGAWQYSTDGGDHWHAIGAVADGATALALSSATLVRFVPVTNFHGTPAGLTVRALDGSSGSFSTSGVVETRVTIDTTTTGDATAISAGTATIATSVTAVNDAPTLTAVTPLIGATEDTPFTITYAALLAAANEADSDGDVLSFRVEAVSTGTLTMGGNAVEAGTTLLSAGDEWAWTPAADASGTLNAFTIRAWDGSAASADSVQVQVTTGLGNDAPILDAEATPQLSGISEDPGPPVNGSTAGSTLVSALVDIGGSLHNVTDPDADPLTGIAVTGVSEEGTLYFSTDDGETWTLLVGTVSDTSALLLSADANTRVYFLPAANAHGTISDAITFVAWDRTSGSNGATAQDTTVGTAFSVENDAAVVMIAPVADTPSVGSPTITKNTDSSPIAITRNAADGVEVTHYKITAVANGALYTDAGFTHLIPAGSFITSAGATTNVYFRPTAAFVGAAGFTVQAAGADDDAGLGGSAVNSTITVNDVAVIPVAQTITFGAIGNVVLGDTVTLAATASSGLPVSFSVISGPATLSSDTLTFTDVGVVTVRASQAGNSGYGAATSVDRSFLVSVGAPPVVTTPTEVPAPVPGGTATLSVGEINPALAYQWQRNGLDLPGATAPSLTLTNVEPPTAGLYTYTATTAGGGGGTSEPVIVGLATTEKVAGAGEQVVPDAVHPNGNVYDQLVLEGDGASLTADPGQITRMSFVDLSDDIVQVEFSGAGTLSLVMDGAPVPAAAANYNQPGVNYVRGNVGIVITGADETTNVAVVSVGRITAVNQTLFRDDAAYDGVANVAFIAIQSSNGQFGGVRTGNVEYFASQGFTGLYAPGVAFGGPINIGDIQAHDDAQPLLVVGSASNVRIAGGNLEQPNGQPVTVDGLTQLTMAPGQTSQGDALPEQTNQGVLQQDGVDVTDLIVVNP